MRANDMTKWEVPAPAIAYNMYRNQPELHYDVPTPIWEVSDTTVDLCHGLGLSETE